MSDGVKNKNIEEEQQETLLAQWQTCVEMANAVSERRDNMNNLFVASFVLFLY